MKPDYDRAATKALETLINYNVTATPVLSVPILKKMPNVLVMSFSEMGNTLGIERHKMVTLFGASKTLLTNSYLPLESVKRVSLSYQSFWS